MWRPVGRGVETARLTSAPERQAIAALPRAGWLAGLVAVVALALAVRLAGLWPPSTSASVAPYDDEGVYIMAAQLLRQGVWPYRDFFFAHPPLGVVSLLPAVSLAFTEWGSPLSFGLARLLMVGMGTLTVALVGLAAARLWGGAGGIVAAGALALDPSSVANSRHIMLEAPMMLLVSAALLAGTLAADGSRSRATQGLLIGLASLVKAQAILVGIAEMLLAAAGRRWRDLTRLVAGMAVALVALLPFALVAGLDPLLRQIVLFQLFRPSDGLAGIGERLASLLAPTGLLFALAAAGGGLVVAWWSGARPGRGALAPVLLWVGLGLLGFLLSRSYYQHYASQVTPGLALLAGGLGVAQSNSRGWSWRAGSVMLATFALLAGMGVTIGRSLSVEPDRAFVVVARYLVDAAPPGTAVLSADAQFNYLASRPLPRAAGGYLVDSYGQLVYTGLGLGQDDLVSAARAALEARQAATVHEIMWRESAQALFRAQAEAAEIVVVHAVGRARLTDETQIWLEDRFWVAESTRRYTIYRRGQP